MYKIRFLCKCFLQFNKDIKIRGEGRYFYCWLDLVWSWFRFGCSPNCYFKYEFHRKSNWEKNRFLTYGRSKRIVRKFNNIGDLEKTFDKRLAYKLFSEFINRKWLDTGECGYEEFRRFVIQQREVIVKPPRGLQGKGIYKYSYAEEDNLQAKYNEIKGLLVEEVIRQHESMKTMNPSSVNTLRIVTFLGREGVNIIGCYMRAGITDSVVDNLHSGGVIAGVDISTGIVYTPGFTVSLYKYLVHPLTGVVIPGFKIPNWEDMLETVKKAGLLIPSIRYVGWDLAILDNGVELVEANFESGHMVQIVDQKGIYEPICTVLNAG